VNFDALHSIIEGASGKYSTTFSISKTCRVALM